MTFCVYLLIQINTKNKNSYVGYTSNITNRLKLHNTSKGAKFTKGKKWKLIYKKQYATKSQAMKEEIKLKKNRKVREYIKNHYNKKEYENINFTSV
jgi:putative endonuclease|tara:strand:+ start:1884 stop:2171 length:288 start_codon:yes stop_codon:yes gene_type:complete